MSKIFVVYSSKHGRFEIILDEEDYDKVSALRWVVLKDKKHPDNIYFVSDYKTEDGKVRQHRMHRYIMGVDNPSLHVDHVNHNYCDLRKSELRVATSAQNQQNARTRRNKKTSRYKGVRLHRSSKKYEVRITVNKTKTNLGLYRTEEEAARVYDAAAVKHFGKFASINFPETKEYLLAS